MALENLKSIFHDELAFQTETYELNKPADVVDTKLNYNENPLIPQSYGIDVSTEIRGGRDNPILDALLRGRVYEPIRFSQNFTNENLFIEPEQAPFNIGAYTSELETFDPRATTPKPGTLYFNTGNTFKESSFPTDFSTAGLNGEPFTPLSQLGVSFYNGENNSNNLSWETLYNSNHSPKDNPTWQGFSAINYSSNVNRDNLNIKSTTDGRFGFNGSSRTSVISGVGKLLGQVPFLEGDVTDFLQDTGKEPYIVSNIGSGGRLINSNLFGRGLPIERSLTDTVRVAKYLTSPSGLLFFAKQNILALQQIPFTEDLNRMQLDKAGMKDFGAKFNLVYKPFYNPLSSLITTFGRAGGGPAGLISKTEPGLGDLISKIPGLESFGDVIDAPYPKFQNDFYTERSQLANILEFGRIIDGKAPKLLFDLDLPTTDRSPLQDSKYTDDITGLFGNQPYPDFNLQDEQEDVLAMRGSQQANRTLDSTNYTVHNFMGVSSTALQPGNRYGQHNSASAAEYPDFNIIDEEENRLVGRGKGYSSSIDNFSQTDRSQITNPQFGPYHSDPTVEYPNFDATDRDINTPAGNRGKSFIGKGESAFNFTSTDRNPNIQNKFGDFEENETKFPPADGSLRELGNTFITSGSVGDKHTLMDFGNGDNIDGTTRFPNKIEDAHPQDTSNGVIEGSEN